MLQRKILIDHERLTGNFFRKVDSLELFKRFFESFNLWESLELPEEPTNDELFQAWKQLAAPGGNRAEEDLKCVNDIAREKGRYWLTSMAEKAKIEDYLDMTLPHLALILYLEDRYYFFQAYELFVIEKTDRLKIFKGAGIPPFDPEKAPLMEFQDELRKLLYQSARGKRIRFEPFACPDKEKWMLVIPHEYYLKTDQVFDDAENIVSRQRRPVVEMVIVYYYKKGILKLKAGRGKRPEKVSALFARHVLGVDEEDYFTRNSVINLDPLKEGNFDFPLDIGDRLHSITVVEATYQEARSPGTVFQVKNIRNGILELIRKYSPEEIKITAARIRFQFSVKKKDVKTAELSLPNFTNLDETGRDSYIEKLLENWGFIDAEIRNLESVESAGEGLHGDFQWSPAAPASQ